MHRFYQADLEIQSHALTLNEVESNHACKVLRLTQGTVIQLINGSGLVATSKIVEVHHKRCRVEIESIEVFELPKTSIHLAICPTKSNDRFEWFLEKAVEIGVDEITPLWSENSERSKLNIERLDKVILSAVKQSLRAFKPRLNPMTKVKEFILSHPHGLLAHCNEDFHRVDFSAIPFRHEMILMIGPEGDFSVSEIECALQHDVKTVSLGNNRLRTETAGLVGITLLNASRP
jgi:16S rRNA (uracil1498-N3)-methyltransferase